MTLVAHLPVRYQASLHLYPRLAAQCLAGGTLDRFHSGLRVPASFRLVANILIEP